MKKFNIGDRVIVIEDNEVKRGTIKNVYSDLQIFIVEFNDGSVGKVVADKIALEPKAETTAEAEAQEKREDVPRMKSEVTITPDEFREVVVGALSEYVHNTNDSIVEKLEFGIKVIPILTTISARLFYDKESENSDNVE